MKIHTAFDHDNFHDFAMVCEKDRRAILALGEALVGSRKPMVVTSGVALGAATPGRPAEERVFVTDHPLPRVAGELAADALVRRGVAVSVVRLPQVHDTVKQGLVTYLVALAREKQVSAYVGEGTNRWAAAQVDDVGRLFRLVLERDEPGARYHAVAEEGVPLRRIAETVAAGLGMPARSIKPAEAAAHFGFLAHFAAMEMTAKSSWKRDQLGWQPTGPGLIEDLGAMAG